MRGEVGQREAGPACRVGLDLSGASWVRAGELVMLSLFCELLDSLWQSTPVLVLTFVFLTT